MHHRGVHAPVAIFLGEVNVILPVANEAMSASGVWRWNLPREVHSCTQQLRTNTAITLASGLRYSCLAICR